MGTEIADYDGDGLPDIFVTNFSDELNTLYRNLGKLLFDDVTLKAGLQSGLTPLGFGTRLFDIDNDGDLDIHVTNGHVIDNVALYHPRLTYAQKDLLYENLGNGTFKDISASAGPAFALEHVGRGSVVADLDNDGDLDIVISNLNARPFLFRNDSTPHGHWLSLDLSRPDARIEVTAAGKTQHRYATSVSSYLSSSDSRVHIGLGASTKADRVQVIWANGTKQMMQNVAGDREIRVSGGSSPPGAKDRSPPPAEAKP